MPNEFLKNNNIEKSTKKNLNNTLNKIKIKLMLKDANEEKTIHNT